MLLVEELDAAKASYANSGRATGNLTGTWAAVTQRQVNHTVGAGGSAVKVTFSDTFRAALNCNGNWGSIKLYVDEKAVACQNGAYNWSSSGLVHNRIHPVNQPRNRRSSS